MWDTSDVSRSRELVVDGYGFDPYARTSPSSAEAAAALVAALEAHAPDAKVLPLITKEAAAEKDQVSLHSYPYLTRAVRVRASCTVPQPSELELTL